ncbi:phage portal protein (plasmid) [Microtetraspora malaysiensis]|uniref:phage portal protein n=1 Tax=Microtetraspora malaysiensis TaxID=161358 RepID=UPI003D8DCB85
MARRRFAPGLRGPAAVLPVLETKSYRIGGDYSGTWFNQMSAAARRAWPIDRAVAEGIERTVWVYKSVQAIASHESKLDIEIHDGKGEVIKDHPLAKLLNKGMANPLESGRQFRKRLSMQILLSPAGAFVEVTRNMAGDPIQLDLLPPSRTRPVPGVGPDGQPLLLHHFETITLNGERVGIDPERVLWFRDPHPTDPYRGITPMEAAGLSVDMDYLSRLWNVNFIRNDARPAMAVGVKGDLSDGQVRRIEEQFGRGPMESGKLSVVNAELSMVDLGARPREMSYSDMAARAKEEVLGAFGVGETVLGNASGRTYDNADAELFQFWAITMLPHLDIVTSGFRPVLDDEDESAEHDTSTVEVLRRPEVARRQEAREEFDKGLLSPKEYREIAGHEEVDNAYTRALYVPQGRDRIPTQEGDEVELGLAPAEGDITPPPDDQAAPGEPAPGEQPPGDVQPPNEPPVFDTGDQAMGQAMAGLQAALDGGTGMETKALDTSQPPDPEQVAEEALREILVQLTRRLVERTAAKTTSPKARKGTRHFQPEPGFETDTRVGDDSLDTGRIVDPDRWQDDAEKAVTPALIAAAAAAVALLGLPATPDLPGLPGLPGAPAGVGDAAQEAAKETALWLARQIGTAAAGLAARIWENDEAGRDMSDIVAAIRHQLPPLEMWAGRAAQQAAVHVVHAAQAAAAKMVVAAGGMVSKVWKTRLNSQVRATHQEAEGQVRDLGEPFHVGEALLRWPCDITGPIRETAGCRCRMRLLISLRPPVITPARR